MYTLQRKYLAVVALIGWICLGCDESNEKDHRLLARDDTAETEYLKPIQLDVLANDVGPDKGSLVIKEVVQPKCGLVTNLSDSLLYEPTAECEGVVSFTYVASSGSAVSNPAKVTVTVGTRPRCNDTKRNGDETDIDCGGECPKCAIDRVCLKNEDCISGNCQQSHCMTPKTWVEIITDENTPSTPAPVYSSLAAGTPFEVSIATQPAHGEAAVKENLLVYIPAPQYFGNDQFEYELVGQGWRASGIAIVTVKSVNDVPVLEGQPRDQTIRSGEVFLFQATATDVEGKGQITFFIENCPPWASFDSRTGFLDGIPTIADVGIYSNIVVGVQDGEGARVSYSPFTITVIDGEPPPVVSGVEAKAGDSKVQLTWKNPGTTDFAGVMIRSGFAGVYPTSKDQGFLKYAGKEESAIIDGILNGASNYFSIFTFDTNGNFSEPVKVEARAKSFWEIGAELPKLATDFKATVVGEKIFVSGRIRIPEGSHSFLNEYDPGSDTWTNCSGKPSSERGCAFPATPRTEHGVVEYQDKLYLFGGCIGDGQCEGFGSGYKPLEYDPSVNEFTNCRSIDPVNGCRDSTVDNRRDRNLAFRVKDKIYIMPSNFGGDHCQDESDIEEHARPEEYSPSTNTWTNCAAGEAGNLCAPMPRQLRCLTISGAVVNDEIHLIGTKYDWRESDSQTPFEPYDKTEHFIYHPSTNSWTYDKGPKGRMALVLASLGDKLYVIARRAPDLDFVRVEEFDTKTNQWRRLLFLPEVSLEPETSAHLHEEAVVAADGKLYFFMNWRRGIKAYIYDPTVAWE